jgi:hypothetical protein
LDNTPPNPHVWLDEVCDSSTCLLHQGHEADENEADNASCLGDFSPNIGFEGKNWAMLYVLNAPAYVMHVRLNAGESFTVVLEDQENGIIGHVLSYGLAIFQGETYD